MAQLSAACWVERVASEANPVDAPRRNKHLITTPDAEADVVPMKSVLQLRPISLR